jgi:hypothetical protein
MIGDPVPDVFPPDDPVARFVVAMSMANNDIDRALRVLLGSGEVDGPDFTYRVRVVTGHLVEAIDALVFYSQTCAAVPRFLKRLPADAQKQLKTVRAALQEAGPKALEETRDNTFHYPSPNPRYSPTSDAKLRDVLAAMTDSGVQVHLDGDTHAITLTFADEAALNLAMGKPATTNDEVRHRAEVARDGALAFVAWATALIRTYMKMTGADFGKPIVSDKPKPASRQAS